MRRHPFSTFESGTPFELVEVHSSETLENILESYAPAQPDWPDSRAVLREPVTTGWRFLLLSGAALLAFGAFHCLVNREDNDSE